MINRVELLNNLELGENIFNSIPKNLRPGWGSAILMHFDGYIINVPLEINELYELIDFDNNWMKAKSQFEKIRQFYLKNKNYKPKSFLLLAELVAKITFNETNPPNPFDFDSGWYIPRLAIQTTEYFNSVKLTNDVFNVLLLHYKERI